jgi:HK97 family phage prohead protease
MWAGKESKMPETKRYLTYRAEVKSVDEDEGTVDMLIPMSTESVDRMDEVISLDAWTKTIKDFKKRPVLLSSHDYGDLRKQIGEHTRLKVTEDGLMSSPKYYVNQGNPEADWAFVLAKKGMAAFSVGFIPRTWEDAKIDEKGKGKGGKVARRTYTDVELLEISQVCVPANRDARQGVKAKAANDPILSDLITEIEAAEIVDLTGEPEVPSKKEYSQSELKDELDFVLSICKSITLNDENQVIARSLMAELKRLTGSDIPEKITTEPEAIVAPVKELTLEEATAIIQAAINEWRQSHNDSH